MCRTASQWAQPMMLRQQCCCNVPHCIRAEASSECCHESQQCCSNWFEWNLIAAHASWERTCRSCLQFVWASMNWFDTVVKSLRWIFVGQHFGMLQHVAWGRLYENFLYLDNSQSWLNKFCCFDCVGETQTIYSVLFTHVKQFEGKRD